MSAVYHVPHYHTSPIDVIIASFLLHFTVASLKFFWLIKYLRKSIDFVSRSLYDSMIAVYAKLSWSIETITYRQCQCKRSHEVNRTSTVALINELKARSTRAHEAARRVATKLWTTTPPQSTFVDVYRTVQYTSSDRNQLAVCLKFNTRLVTVLDSGVFPSPPRNKT